MNELSTGAAEGRGDERNLNPVALLRAYDAEVRARPRAMPGFVVEHIDGVTLLSGGFNFVSHWDLSGHDPEQVVHRLASRFRQAGQSLIWDIHGHDGPDNLGAILESKGLEETQASTLMALDLGRFPDQTIDHDVQQVRDLAGLRDFVRVTVEAFGREDDWVIETFRDRLEDDLDQLFVAYVQGRPVGCSRIECPADSRFAGLYGGGVSPGFRGLGIYGAMIRTRAAEARARGFYYLTTTARETSRPILERLGFQPLTPVRRWVLAN